MRHQHDGLDDPDHPDNWVPSEEFWDTLPKIFLTHRALIENDRRERLKLATLAKRQPTLRPSPRPQQPTRVKQFLSLYSAHNRNPSPELRHFARHGGPDLTDIRDFSESTMSDQTSQPTRHLRSTKRTASTKCRISTRRAASIQRTASTQRRISTRRAASTRHSASTRCRLSTPRTASTRRAASARRRQPTKPLGPYDKDYQLKLARAGIFTTEETDDNYDIVLPANYDNITVRLKARRPSLSPSRFPEQDFQRFRRQAKQEITEVETMSKSVSVIEGDGRQIYSRMGGRFNNLVQFDGHGRHLAMVVPDSYDGAPPVSIDDRVFDDLYGYIVPSTNTIRPAVPNFFLEGKGRMGHEDVAIRQAAHTGAIGARGMMRLQCYPSHAPQYDGNAYSFTSTYCGDQLKIYTIHVTAPKTSSDPPHYYMSQIGAYSMTHNSKVFREGATAYRNARDLAKEYRDSFIHQANLTAKTLFKRSRSHKDEDSSFDSDISTENLAPARRVKRSRYTTLSDVDDEDEEDENEDEEDEDER